MRTTIDIPDPIYRELKSRAALEGTSVKQLIVQSVSLTLRGADKLAARKRNGFPPVLDSKHPGSLKLGEEGVYEYIPFP
jgi:hypothetical protein